MPLDNYTVAQGLQPASAPTTEPQGPWLSPQRMAEPEQPRPPAKRLDPDRLVAMYNAWEQAKNGEMAEQYRSARYYHGKQWTDQELKALMKRKQPPTVKNRIKRKVDFLVGVEQSQRRDPKGVPRNPQGEQAAYVGTSVLRYIADNNKWPAIASDAAHDGLVRGIGVQWAGAVEINQRLEIKKSHIPVDRFFYDPRSEKWDFSDARYLGVHQWMDIDEAKELLPWAVEKIENLAEHARVGTTGPLPQLAERDRRWIDPNVRRIFLIQIWYKHYGEWVFDFLVGYNSLCPSEPSKRTDPQTGQEMEVPPMDCRSPYVDEDGQTVHPYEAWSPYVDETGDRYGVVRDMMPIQDEINKRSSKALHLLTMRQTKAQKGAVDDVDKMKAELAKPDGHVEYNPGSEFEVIDTTFEAKGNLELLQDAKAEIENLGPNPGLIGRGVEQQSGRAILAQQNSGMTELSPVFERIREWKLRCYRRDWNLARQFYDDERIIRISGDADAMQHMTINRSVMTPQGPMMENAIAEVDIDIILDEGPDTVTMREELMQQLSQLGSEVVPPELLIELSNIGEKDKILRILRESKEPPPEIQAMQKRMASLEEMMAAASLDKTRADTEAVHATTIKTLTEAGITSETVGPAMQAFPFYTREPSFLDQSQSMAGMPQNALAGPPSGEMGLPPPEMRQPQNGLAGPPEPFPDEAPPDGLQGLPIPPAGEDFLAASSTPWEEMQAA